MLEREEFVERQKKASKNLKNALVAAYNYNLTEYLKGLSTNELMEVHMLIIYDDIIGIKINILECINQEISYRCMLDNNDKNCVSLNDLVNAFYYGYLEYLIYMLTDNKLNEIKECLTDNSLEEVHILDLINIVLSEREKNKQLRLQYVK